MIRIPAQIKLIFKIYLTGIVLFTLLRLGLFILSYQQLSIISEGKFTLILKAFFMGWRFDTVISSYLLAIPLLVLTIAEGWKSSKKIISQFTKWYLYLLYPIAFLICFADIPYYLQFGNRFNINAFQWLDSPVFVFKMIFQEPKYWLAILPFILYVFLWIIILKKLFRNYISEKTYFETKSLKINTIQFSIINILIFSLLFLGVRGRVEKKSPIRIGTAFFSPYSHINNLGLNPVFTLLRSYLDDVKNRDKEISFMDENQAFEIIQKEFNFEPIEEISPIARQENIGRNPNNYNIVIVIMESMGAANLERFGNPNKLCPALDTLANNSISFDKAYTTGIHTHNGIFSTLFSLPALPQKHPMNIFPIPEYDGISKTLKENSYKTMFFLTHDEQFDNIGGFLMANNFDKIISQKDYPSKEVVNTLGVPDHIMFDKGIEVLSKTKEPFFASFLTSTNHGPYEVPKDINFKPKSSDVKIQTIEYSDWAIGQFIENAKKTDWFENTIFVFVSDHGFHSATPYEISLSYHHTPIIFYSPKIIDSVYSYQGIASQMDIYPSLMHILGHQYINNTLGVNLFETSRNYAPYTNGSNYGAIGDSLLFIKTKESGDRFYDLTNSFKTGINSDSIKDLIKIFTYSNFEISTYLLKHS